MISLVASILALAGCSPAAGGIAPDASVPDGAALPGVDGGGPGPVELDDAGRPVPDRDGGVVPRGDGALPPGDGLIVGVDGLAGFAAMTDAQKAKLRAAKVFFLHQSVGANITDGAEANGFPFEWAGGPSDYTGSGGILGENLFTSLGVSNGNPVDKINAFSAFLADQNTGAHVDAAGLKFGYADIESGKNPAQTKSEYLAAVSGWAQRYPNAHIYHLTPALTGDDGENATRAEFGAWMKTTFGKSQVVFDLQAVESSLPDGTACTASGAPSVCAAYRDPADTIRQGHLNADGASRVAQAFLYALSRAVAR